MSMCPPQRRCRALWLMWYGKPARGGQKGDGICRNAHLCWCNVMVCRRSANKLDVRPKGNAVKCTGEEQTSEWRKMYCWKLDEMSGSSLFLPYWIIGTKLCCAWSEDVRAANCVCVKMSELNVCSLSLFFISVSFPLFYLSLPAIALMERNGGWQIPRRSRFDGCWYKWGKHANLSLNELLSERSGHEYSSRNECIITVLLSKKNLSFRIPFFSAVWLNSGPLLGLY